MSSGVSHRHVSDPMLLWLWCRPIAVAPIQPLSWEPPYAAVAVPVVPQRKRIWLASMKMQVQSLTLLSRLSIAMSCGVGHRRGSDPVLLWLWHRPAATTPIIPLAWEPPNAMGGVLKKGKKTKIIIIIKIKMHYLTLLTYRSLPSKIRLYFKQEFQLIQLIL